MHLIEQTYSRWKKKYGGMGIKHEAAKKENEHLRRSVFDLTLDKLILKEAASGSSYALRVVVLSLISCAVR